MESKKVIAVMGATGKPFSASSTAGSSVLASGRRPKRCARSHQAAAAPGTVMV